MSSVVNNARWVVAQAQIYAYTPRSWTPCPTPSCWSWRWNSWAVSSTVSWIPFLPLRHLPCRMEILKPRSSTNSFSSRRSGDAASPHRVCCRRQMSSPSQFVCQEAATSCMWPSVKRDASQLPAKFTRERGRNITMCWRLSLAAEFHCTGYFKYLGKNENSWSIRVAKILPAKKNGS